jgi:hypothetical protein
VTETRRLRHASRRKMLTNKPASPTREFRVFSTACPAAAPMAVSASIRRRTPIVPRRHSCHAPRTMQVLNDVTIRGTDFAGAVRRILPRQRAGQLGYVVIGPAALGALRLEGFYAVAEVPAEGTWTDAVALNARLLRGFALGRPPAVFRLVFFGGRLAINGSTIGASRATPDALAVPPSYVPTNRLGSPMGHGWKPRTR